MAGLKAVRRALASQVQDNIYPPLQAEANPKDQINPPSALVIPPRGTFATYGGTMGSDNMGMGTEFMGLPDAQPAILTATGFRLDLLIVVARNDIDRTQEALDQWFGYENEPGISVSAAMAVALDPTLGGVVRWCNALTADAYNPVEWSGAMYFGARIHFEIGLV